jgi:hypothetical protein
MPRLRWPAVPPPLERGVRGHGRLVLAAAVGITVELTEVLLHPTGMDLRMQLTAFGRTAERVRYETRPLTDPDDPSAQWSFLHTLVRAGDCEGEGEADPYRSLVRSTGLNAPPDLRIELRYWIPVPPGPEKVAVTVRWTRLGLPATTSTVETGPLAHPPP